jgi:hypothetical protein
VIDRQVRAGPFAACLGLQRAVGGQGERRVRGDHVHVIGLHLEAVRRFEHRHGGRFCEQVGKLAVVPGVKMLHQYKGHAGVLGQCLQQLHECLQPAGRRTDADHREPARRRGG